jgi:hypothetical protein
MHGAGRQRAEWNTALMQDGVAPAYLLLLQHMALHLGPVKPFFRCGGRPWGTQLLL